MKSRKKVLVLFCGGTIVMKRNSNGKLAPPHDKEEAVQILKDIEPELHSISDYEVEYIANIDSTNMTPTEWDTILDILEKEYDHWDGFVITHGTDTLAYTASALSIAIDKLGKPIVITGSQIPGAEIHTDARRNLVNAVKLATMDISGVYVVFDERIIHGGRVSKDSESKLDAFTTINKHDAGEIRIEIELNGNPKRSAGSIKVSKGFEPDIFIYTLTPGCDPTDLEFLLKNERIRGIVIRAFGTGNIPDNFNKFFELAEKAKLPVIISSQCLHGSTEMDGYEVSDSALKYGAIEGHDQSLEMLTVKLMWAIDKVDHSDHAMGFDDIKKIVHTNHCGELMKVC